MTSSGTLNCSGLYPFKSRASTWKKPGRARTGAREGMDAAAIPEVLATVAKARVRLVCAKDLRAENLLANCRRQSALR